MDRDVTLPAAAGAGAGAGAAPGAAPGARPALDAPSRAPADLAVDAIAVGYEPGRPSVVESLSLSVPAGAIGCLLGPSGCGKTTVLRAIAGFEPLRAGAVRLGGVELSRPGRTVPPEQRRIGMVFQDHALFPHLSVLDNVRFGLRGRPDARDVARRMLELVGLGAHASRWPHELSGGQRQRVALARALAPSPRLLLLDEPFSNLDVELRERLGGELAALLRAQRITALLVTHDQHEAFAMADEIGVMQHGRIRQWDTPHRLYHRPAERFVADFVGQGVFVPGTVLDAHRLDSALGVVRSDEAIRCNEHGGPCPPGCAVDLLLRPDDVVHDDDAPMQAAVRAKAFRGAEFLYTLQLDDGTTVLSLVPSHHDHPVGSRIGIRLALDHVVAYRRDAPSAAPPEGGAGAPPT